MQPQDRGQAADDTHACLAVARAFECAVQKQRPRPRCSTIGIATANTPAMLSVNCATSCERPEHEASGHCYDNAKVESFWNHTQGELIRIGASLRTPRQKSRFSGTSGLLQSDAAPRRARASLARGLGNQFELNVHQPFAPTYPRFTGKTRHHSGVSPNRRETNPMQFFENVQRKPRVAANQPQASVDAGFHEHSLIGRTSTIRGSVHQGARCAVWPMAD